MLSIERVIPLVNPFSDRPVVGGFIASAGKGLSPALHPGDVVILDNLNLHKSPRAAQMLEDRGAWFLFLPRYSPDLNPIEMAFAKLKAHLRKAKARTYDELCRAVGNICDLFQPEECWNYLKAAGYVAD